MSKPFFIWTMRRTGGTSLTTLLSIISEHPNLQEGNIYSIHEPFNKERILGHFIIKYNQGISKEILLSKLQETFQNTPNMKHCYELFSKGFNDLIVESVLEQNYGHIFLKREDEVSRIFSLFLAEQTSVWGPEQKKDKYNNILSGKEKLRPFDIDRMVEHYKWCNVITNHIQTKLEKHGQTYKIVSFEEFYMGEREERLRKLYELFDYLGFEHSVREEYKEKIREKVFNSSQDSRSILEYVPNYKEAIEILQKK